jgi:hypothetical protein
MKKISVIIGILFLGILYTFSSIQEASAEWRPHPQKDPSLPIIQLQLILRDPDGNLVAYIEPTTLYITSVPLTHEFLDTKIGTKFTKDGNAFEQFEYGNKITFSGEVRQIATYQQGHAGKSILIFRHDGYLASPGDTLEVNWKIVRELK